MSPPPFVLLIILDGWGIAQTEPGNAIATAETKYYDYLIDKYPNTLLEASGPAVGLPPGEPGNSETGHYNLGAGYVVPQDVVRISQSIEDGQFFERSELQQLFQHVKDNDSNLHVLGLLSSAKVHSSLDHLFAFLEAANRAATPPPHLHLFTDGRDTPPYSSRGFIKQVETFLQNNRGKICSLVGRYYAMDRDKRWPRTEKAYNLLVHGEGHQVRSALEGVNRAYQRGESDEFITPTVITTPGESFEPIQNGDGVFFFNFRFDRPRQLTRAFVEKDFNSFSRENSLEDIYFLTMTPYQKGLPVSGTLFDHLHVEIPLARALAEEGFRQLHIAESEKFPHVTYFLNGGQEITHGKEEWIEIPSPKVATYDLQPEMSAEEVTLVLSEKIRAQEFRFLVVNFANPDMVGHTGDIDATIRAVEFVDQCLGKIVPLALRLNGSVVITADHGNAERLRHPESGKLDTHHNLSPVPFIIADRSLENARLQLDDGALANVAPTILDLLSIKPPSSMTAASLISQ